MRNYILLILFFCIIINYTLYADLALAALPESGENSSVSDIVINGNLLSLKFCNDTGTALGEDVYSAAALYAKGSNKLIAVVSSNEMLDGLAADANKGLTFTFDDETDINDYDYKLFFWNNLSNMKPIYIGGKVTTGGYAAIIDPIYYKWEQGTIAENGVNRDTDADLKSRFRTVGYLPVDSNWKKLKFESAADKPTGSEVHVYVFAFDASYKLIERSALLSFPFEYTIPEGTAYNRYVVIRQKNTDPILAKDYENKITISYIGGYAAIIDPIYYKWEQGTIAENGVNRDTDADLKSRFRTVGYLPVDSNWKKLKFESTADKPTGSEVHVYVFAFDASYKLIERSALLSFPFEYTIPKGTAYTRYVVIRQKNTDPILAKDYENKITVSYTITDPDSFLGQYTLIAQNIVPDLMSVNTVSGGQGANFINGNLWYAGASSDGHATANGTANIYSVNWETGTFTKKHTFTHNFGHLNAFSYDSDNDNLIFGNGSGDYSLLPQFFAVKVGNMNLDGVNTLDGVGATTFNVPPDFGTKCNVIWTDVEDVAIMMTDDATVFRRIRLARGTEKLIYGTYSATTQTGYNGTWEILSNYKIKTKYEVLQGAAFIDGKILMGFGHGPLSIGTAELFNDGPIDYKVWEQASATGYFATVWYDEVTKHYGGIRSNEVWIWNNLPLTFTKSNVSSTDFR